MKGSFRARALTGVLCETKEGKPQVAVELELLDEAVKGQKSGWYGQLSSEESIKFTVKALRTAGWVGDDLSAIKFDARECTLVMEEEQYEEEVDGVAETKTRTRVKYINASGGVTVKAPMDAAKAKAFAASMKGKVLAISKALPNAAKPATAAPAPSGDPRPEPPLADIPF